MARPRAKKKKVSSGTHTRSVFLYGSPNAEKRSDLEKLQADYTDAVNFYISLLSDREDCLLQLLQNSKKDPLLRKLEKESRVKALRSAYSQNAFDEAVTKLHNRLDNIRKDVIAATGGSVFAISILLFHAVLTGQSREEMCDLLARIRDSYKAKEKIQYYDKLRDTVKTMEEKEFHDSVTEAAMFYHIISDEYRIPVVEKAHVMMDTRLCSLEKAKDVTTSHVLSVTIPDRKGKRIEVPVQADRDALRRMEQYGISGSMRYTITAGGSLKLTCSFEKKTRTPEEHSAVIGVDVGITDAFHTSEGQAIESFQPVIDFYQTEVEPAFGNLSTLRNRKQQLRRFLKKHKGALPEKVILNLRKRMDHLEKDIRQAHAPYRKKRHYYQLVEHTIRNAVDTYIESLHGDKTVLTAMELLDIKEFNKSRMVNGMLSVFSRGKLAEKLMEELSWHGFPFVQVEPAYTSQICPECGCLDKASRNGKVFHCTCCGHTDDADHVGSINIKARAEDKELIGICEKYPYSKKERHAAIQALQAERNKEWKKEQAATA